MIHSQVEAGRSLPLQVLLALGGAGLGIGAANAFQSLFLSLFGSAIGGSLIPLALSVGLGALLARRQMQLGVGMIAGALVFTIFSMWLFYEFSQGLDF